MASVFNVEVWKQYVESPQIPALVFEAHELFGKPLLLDIRKCRANALKESPFDFPVFSPLDSIVRAEEKLYDLAYIDREITIKSGQNVIRMLPYLGPGWYTKPALEYLLSSGKIGWKHVKFGLNASAHLPRDFLKRPLEIMSQAWGDHENSKRCINAMIGLWYEKPDYTFGVRTTSEECDALMDKFFCKNNIGDGYWDYVYKTQLLSGGVTMRPFHDWCMCLEHTRMAQALDLIREHVPSKRIFQLGTDSILFSPPANKRKACLQLGETTFRDLKRSKLIPITTTDSSEKVSRVTEEDKRLRAKHQLPIRHKHEVIFTDTDWRIVDPHETIRKGEGLFIQGCAGTGKSHLARELIEILRETFTVAIIAKTHTAALNLGGSTCQHFIFKQILHGSCKYDWIVLDEVSMLSLQEWVHLQKLCFLGVRWVLLGDFEQFGPIGGHVFAGSMLDEDCVQRSRLLKIMAQGNIVSLTECKRSDVALFRYYSSLISGGSRFAMALEDVLSEARSLFPRKRGLPEFSLVISHRMRRSINKRINELSKKDALKLEGEDDFYVYPGLRLIGHLQEKKQGVLNNAFYIVKTVAEDKITIQCKISGKEMTLSHEFVAQYLRLSHALTIAGIQGATLDGRIRIFTNHPRFTLRHLFVTISRATSYANVEVI